MKILIPILALFLATPAHAEFSKEMKEFIKLAEADGHGRKALKRKYNEGRLEKIKKRSDGTLTAKIIKKLKENADQCQICLRKFTPKMTKTLEHLHPISKGGMHSIYNVAIVCLRDNMRKGSKGLAQFWEYVKANNIDLSKD